VKIIEAVFSHDKNQKQKNKNHHHSDRTTPPTCSCPNIVKWRLPGLENQHTAPLKKKKKLEHFRV